MLLPVVATSGLAFASPMHPALPHHAEFVPRHSTVAPAVLVQSRHEDLSTGIIRLVICIPLRERELPGVTT